VADQGVDAGAIEHDRSARVGLGLPPFRRSKRERADGSPRGNRPGRTRGEGRGMALAA